MRNIIFIVIAALLLIPFILLKNSPEEYYKIAGYTQGTTYHITYSSPDKRDLSDDITDLLAKFDSSLSTYQSYSVITKINTNVENTEVDQLFEKCFNKSEEIHEITRGAFDITVGPLVEAWGFGKEKKMNVTGNEIDSILKFVGMEKVKLLDGKIIKEDPRIKLDVNAIAQGYSVDYLAGFMEDSEIKNYMIEIGGEIRTKGKNPKGEAWKIGIDKPSEDNAPENRKLQAIVQLKNKSLATSGNYRKFYEEDGQKYVHTINPKTGYTVRSNLLSATVLANDCITADAYATAFMVMGLKQSKTILDELKNVDAYFIYSDENGNFREWYTRGFNDLLIRVSGP